MNDELATIATALTGRYTVERELGQGGMARVYLAEDVKHGRKVAVKVLRPELSSSLGTERFVREIEIASQLTHPHILPLHDSGEASGRLYFVMPFVEGESLRHRIERETTLAAEDALQVAREVLSALDYAHRRNIVHRDIKPENVLLADGHAVVADFGIARAIGEAGGYALTSAGAPIGTPMYMSPEQALGWSHIDGRTDIHSFGRVLYEMIVGELPARPCDRDSVREGRFTDLPRSHRAPLESLPDRAVRALVKALAEHPDDRFATAREFADQLGPPQRGTAQWRAVPAPESGGKSVGTGAAVTLTVAAVAVAYFMQRAGAPVATILAIVLVLLAAGAASGVLAYRRRRRVRTQAGPEPDAATARGTPSHGETLEVVESIAVLPFADLSAEQDQEYFSDGITEELLNALAKIAGLRVAARTSSFHFKGKNEDVRKTGDALGVETILEGSVRKSDNRVRITAQLVSARDGFHIWSDTYDRELADIFAVQQEIASEIVDALRIKLPGGDTPPAVTERGVDPEAHNLYLKGRYLWNMRTKDALQQAAEYFRQATDRDPAYAAAHAGLADAYLLLGSYSHLPPQKALSQAKSAVERALSLDDTLAEAHATRGQVLRSELDWKGEEQEYRRAIELNPSYATAHQWYATMLVALGRTDEALREARRAAELDPLSPAAGVTVAIVVFLTGDYDSAIAQLEKTREIAPNFFSAHAWLSIVHSQKGDCEAAISAAKKTFEFNERAGILNLSRSYAAAGDREQALQLLEQVDKGQYPWAAVAIVHATLNEPDVAIKCLERAFDQEGWSFFALQRVFLLYINVGPWWEPLRSDPRFQELLGRMKFPE